MENNTDLYYFHKTRKALADNRHVRKKEKELSKIF